MAVVKQVQLPLQATVEAEVGLPYLALEVVGEDRPYWASVAEEEVVDRLLLAGEALDGRSAEEVVEDRYYDLGEVEECMTRSAPVSSAAE